MRRNGVRSLKRKILSSLIIFSIFAGSATAEYRFADAGQIPWAASSVEKLYQEGIMSGVNDREFAPNAPITRAQLVGVLGKVAKDRPIIRTNFPFEDVHTDDWYYPMAKKLYSMGVIEGVGGQTTKFAPNQPVTRQEAAVLFARALNISHSVSSFPPYRDGAAVSPWARDAVASITKEGAFSLFGNQFQPQKALTRAEAAVILHKLIYGDPAPYEPPKMASRSNSMLDQRLTNAIQSGLGVPYRYGGTTTSGFDCSGYTRYVYKQLGVDLPRDSRSQFKVGTPVSLSNMEKGDLIFFDTGGGRITHVGIYVGNNQMAHAPSSGGKSRIDNLDWYLKNYRVAGVKRIL